MALNPLTFTEKVVGNFLNYRLTAYPFSDDRLNAQMRTILSMDATPQTPLLEGPYISLSRAFRTGCAVAIERVSFHGTSLRYGCASRLPPNPLHWGLLSSIALTNTARSIRPVT